MPSLEKFRKSLESFDVDKDTITRSQSGFENLTDKATKPKRAAYFKHAVDVLSEELPAEKFQEIFEGNACCKGGAREKASKAFAKENAHLSLEEKLAKVKVIKHLNCWFYCFKHTVNLNCPWSVCTLIFPPCSLTMFLEIDKPSPLPCRLLDKSLL